VERLDGQAGAVAQERLLGSFVVRLTAVAGRLEVAVLDLRDGDVSRWSDPNDAWRRLLRHVPDGPTARLHPEDPDA
jgi:hypothetical protein